MGKGVIYPFCRNRGERTAFHQLRQRNHLGNYTCCFRPKSLYRVKFRLSIDPCLTTRGVIFTCAYLVTWQ